jgi:hypothetical protein
VAGLREEAAAIRTNLKEMAGDCALGRISRAQMLKATQAGNARLEAIGAELDSAARENVLARRAFDPATVQVAWNQPDAA